MSLTKEWSYGTGNGTGEILAVALRPGNAAAHSADDHIRDFHTAVAQLPDGFYDETGTLAGENVLVRSDGAGASRKFLWHLHSLGVQFSTSYTLPLGKAHMIDWINDIRTGSRPWTRTAQSAPTRGPSTPPT